jgi:hypothetical protein
MSTGWHYIATRIHGDGTETPLDFDVPISGAEITIELSGPGGVTGTIAPEILALKDDDGRPILTPWNTAIYAELDGVIRGGGILVEPEEHGPDLIIDAMGFSAYPSGQCHVGQYSKIGIDPLDAARHIWEHLQSQPAGNLGLVLDDTISPVRVGIPEDPKLTSARTAEHKARTAYEADKADRLKLDNAVKAAEIDVLNAEKSIFKAAGVTWADDSRIIEQSTAPSGGSADPNNIWIDKDDGKVYKYSGGKWVELSKSASALVKDRRTIWTRTQATLADLKKDRDAAKAVETKSKDTWDAAAARLRDEAGGAAQPYVLAAWLNQDLGEQFDELAKTTPFEYLVEHYWDRDPELAVIHHEMRLGYPRLGRRRHDLRFVVGENVLIPPPVTWDGSEYASEILVIGAGEGRTTVIGHVHAPKPTGRLRRVKAVEAKHLPSKGAAERYGAAEVRRSSGEPGFGEEIVVRDSASARIGSYRPGDEILIQNTDGWSAGRDIWVRILAVRHNPESGETNLNVTRAEKVE